MTKQLTKQLIDIDDLNDKINCLIGYLDMYEKGIRKPSELNSVLYEARTWIDSMPIESQWIDVNDRLPDVDEEVLGYDGFSYQILKVWANNDGIKYFVETQENLLTDPTHWMGLPQAPKL